MGEPGKGARAAFSYSEADGRTGQYHTYGSISPRVPRPIIYMFDFKDKICSPRPFASFRCINIENTTKTKSRMRKITSNSIIFSMYFSRLSDPRLKQVI
jgi:hypothetical protein